MTEIIIEDDAVNINVQNVTIELGEELANVDVAAPVAYGLEGVNIEAPLMFDSISGNLSINHADTDNDGYISNNDWNVFNHKQPSGNYIIALTGDAFADGPGTATVTLANVNSNVGSFGNASSVSQPTVNSKGLITGIANVSIQIAESQVTNLTNDLAAKQQKLNGTGFVKASGTSVSYDSTNYQPAYSAFTTNNILFGQGTSTPAQDPNLFWNNTTKRLGVNNSSPQASLDVLNNGAEQLRLSYDGTNRTSFTVNSTSGLTITPGVDSTTAFKLTKADGTTSILNVDTVNSRTGFGVNPTATLHLKAGTTGISSAPLKFTPGTLQSAQEDGAMEYDGTHLYFTSVASRLQIDRQIAKKINTATDANTLITVVNTLTILPTPTANRTLQLPYPFLYPGEEVIIWNKNNGTFSWTMPSTLYGGKDASGTYVGALANVAIYRFVCDGTQWIKTN